MSRRFKALGAVFPMVFRQQEGCRQILLHRRQNTGYMDGYWDIAASGHIEKGETATEAVVRECMEEISIIVKHEDISFAYLDHRVGKSHGVRTYYDIYFVISRFSGMPVIAEPKKCSELAWFNVDKLPTQLIEVRRRAIERYLGGGHYGETING